jgi:hypothetical protein
MINTKRFIAAKQTGRDRATANVKMAYLITCGKKQGMD